MLDAGIGPEFGFRYLNWGTTATLRGTSVAPGVSDAEGSWTEIASAANISVSTYGLYLKISFGSSANNPKNHLMDIGIDPAGGTSYTAVISNLPMGMSGGNGVMREFYFPLFVLAGSSVAVRIQGTTATANTVDVAATFFGQPKNPELARATQYSETIGTVTATTGVAFTPGSSGAAGSWTSVGTTTRELWWWQVGLGINDASLTAADLLLDVAYGDGSNKVMIIENMYHRMTSQETIHHGLAMNCYKRVPGGSTIYVRGSTDIATLDSNYNVLVVGMGG